jgi:hypothetical protein
VKPPPSYYVDAYLQAPGEPEQNVSAYVDELTLSLDVDRVTWKRATIDLKGVPKSLRALCDTTAPGVPLPGISFNVFQRGRFGALTRVYPRPDYTSSNPGIEALYSSWYDAPLHEDTISLSLSSDETPLSDRRRLAATAVDTGATSVRGLVDYTSANSGMGATIIDRMGAGAAAIPAGDRRLFQPGESYWDLFASELNAAGGRFYSGYVYWVLAARDDPPRDLSVTDLTLSTHPAIPGVLVTRADENDSREDDWCDAVICKFDYVNGSGTRVTAYQTAGPAVHSRAQQFEFDRAPSSANLAQQILTRASQRGRSYTLECQLDFAVRPGVNLTLARPDGSITLGMCRSVDYRVYAGTMTVRTQTSQPLE